MEFEANVRRLLICSCQNTMLDTCARPTITYMPGGAPILDLLKVIAIDRTEGLHLVLVDLTIVRRSYDRRRKRRVVRNGLRLLRLRLLFVRLGRATVDGMVIRGFLLLVRHSGASGGVGRSAPRSESFSATVEKVTKMQPKLQPSTAQEGTYRHGGPNQEKGKREECGDDTKRDYRRGQQRKEEALEIKAKRRYR